jgi:hypothetical protein
MTLSYTRAPTYPVPSAGRAAAGTRDTRLRDTFANFGGAR